MAGIKEPAFQYDKSYVYECMEWGLPNSAPAAPGELQWMFLAKCQLWGLEDSSLHSSWPDTFRRCNNCSFMHAQVLHAPQGVLRYLPIR